LKPRTKARFFLDEIGEMSPAMQVKLLRVLQERKVRPVGAHDEMPIDARVIAATNRDLKQMSADGSFREDLFYRISVIPISLPPLRERSEDIPELVAHFVKKFCDQTGREVTISERAMQFLEDYAWHGNVRELEHTIERAVALERTNEIQPERLPDHITNYNPTRIRAEFDLPESGINLVSHLENLEKTYVVEALKQTGGNQTRAAELLQMPVRSLRHLLDKHEIARCQRRCEAANNGENIKDFPFFNFTRLPKVAKNCCFGSFSPLPDCVPRPPRFL
jgi:two-component system response regulator PilR (NtrC family)